MAFSVLGRLPSVERLLLLLLRVSPTTCPSLASIGNGPARKVISRSSTEGTAGSNVSADKDKDHLLRRLDREITIYLKTVVFLNY